jgi:DNA-binding response OmpR family regulator
MTEEAELSGVSILVVEDEYYVANALKRALTLLGAVVQGPIAREDQAIEHVRRIVPNCALLDINLGFGPSFEMARFLMTNGIPFAFLTGYELSTIPEEFSKVKVLQKPADLSDLVRVIRAIALPSKTTV